MINGQNISILIRYHGKKLKHQKKVILVKLMLLMWMLCFCILEIFALNCIVKLKWRKNVACHKIKHAHLTYIWEHVSMLHHILSPVALFLSVSPSCYAKLELIGCLALVSWQKGLSLTVGYVSEIKPYFVPRICFVNKPWRVRECTCSNSLFMLLIQSSQEPQHTHKKRNGWYVPYSYRERKQYRIVCVSNALLPLPVSTSHHS